MKLRKPRITATIWSSGKVICTGATRWVREDSFSSCKFLCIFLKIECYKWRRWQEAVLCTVKIHSHWITCRSLPSTVFGRKFSMWSVCLRLTWNLKQHQFTLLGEQQGKLLYEENLRDFIWELFKNFIFLARIWNCGRNAFFEGYLLFFYENLPEFNQVIQCWGTGEKQKQTFSSDTSETC